MVSDGNRLSPGPGVFPHRARCDGIKGSPIVQLSRTGDASDVRPRWQSVYVSNTPPEDVSRASGQRRDDEHLFGRETSCRGRNLGVIIGISVGVVIAAGIIANAPSDSDTGRPEYLNPATPTTSVRLVPSPTIIGDLFPPTSKGLDITIAARTTDSSAPEGSDDGLNPLGGDDPEDKVMPDVVCMNLQDAQDEIQDHGVFFSKSEDASGEGRRQAWDRNWIVVAQAPAPGEAVGEREAVLSVVKTDEPNDCETPR
jgi:hypothetical protein